MTYFLLHVFQANCNISGSVAPSINRKGYNTQNRWTSEIVYKIMWGISTTVLDEPQ